MNKESLKISQREARKKLETFYSCCDFLKAQSRLFQVSGAIIGSSFVVSMNSSTTLMSPDVLNVSLVNIQEEKQKKQDNLEM